MALPRLQVLDAGRTAKIKDVLAHSPIARTTILSSRQVSLTMLYPDSSPESFSPGGGFHQLVETDGFMGTGDQCEKHIR
jgi:hypothetical protein